MTLRFKLGELLTVDDLAEQLKVSLKTVRSWIYLRKIPFTKIGRRVYFSVGVVEEILRRNAVPALSGQGRSDMCPAGMPIPTHANKGGASESKEGMKHG
jgi:excisionase family DNA binding protein